MDRLNRTLAGCGLALWLAATGAGCRSTRSEVPPGRMPANNGPTGAVGFSNEAHPLTGANPAPYSATNGAPGAMGQLGTPPPGAAAGLGAPTNNLYGPPGSSPLGREGSAAGAPASTPAPAPSDSGALAPTLGGAPAQSSAPALPRTGTPGDPGTQFPPQ